MPVESVTTPKSYISVYHFLRKMAKEKEEALPLSFLLQVQFIFGDIADCEVHRYNLHNFINISWNEIDNVQVV